MRHDIVFRNADVIDGTGHEGFLADVAVDGGRITRIGTVTGAGNEEIDASGMVLAPGFIDVHTHDDFALLSDPVMHFKTLQGVTTVVTGNCGTSAVPLGEWCLKVTGTGPAVNAVPLVGHGSIREKVLGRDNTGEPDIRQLQEMVALVEEALDAGAAGISTGLVYIPGAYSTIEEILALTRPVAARRGIYASHIRNEGRTLLESIDEALQIGRTTGIKVQISHLKAIGAENFGKMPDAITMIRAAQSSGLDVMADQYPYSRGSTLLEQLVMRGALDGPSPFGFVQGRDVLVASTPGKPEWEGQTLDVIAESLRMDVPAAARHIVSAIPNCFIVYENQSEENIATVLREDFVMIGSDGIPSGSRPHPRLHHTFPRVLGEYSRDRAVVPLHVAVYKMTGMCAARFAVQNRGTIAEGHHADLVLLDVQQVRDTGTYHDPSTVPDGIIGTWVNGTAVARSGVVTGERPGRLLRTLD